MQRGTRELNFGMSLRSIILRQAPNRIWSRSWCRESILYWYYKALTFIQPSFFVISTHPLTANQTEHSNALYLRKLNYWRGKTQNKLNRIIAFDEGDMRRWQLIITLATKRWWIIEDIDLADIERNYIKKRETVHLPRLKHLHSFISCFCH